jgi:hypothetical protein
MLRRSIVLPSSMNSVSNQIFISNLRFAVMDSRRVRHLSVLLTEKIAFASQIPSPHPQGKPQQRLKLAHGGSTKDPPKLYVVVVVSELRSDRFDSLPRYLFGERIVLGVHISPLLELCSTNGCRQFQTKGSNIGTGCPLVASDSG